MSVETLNAVKSTNPNRIRVYGCGGTGVNLSRILKSEPAKTKLHINNVDVAIIDSSETNLENLQEFNECFIIPDMKGAGKDRKKTWEHFKQDAPLVLSRFKPSSYLNIVISSFGGGTGSGTAPAIVYDLLKSGESVIFIGVVSETSSKEINNAIETIYSLDNISELVGAPVPTFIPREKNLEKMDAEILTFISVLSQLSDPDNIKEFDESDLRSFLRFHEVSEAPIGLCEIKPYSNMDDKVVIDSDAILAATILISTSKSSVPRGGIAEHYSKALLVNEEMDLDEVRIDHLVGTVPKLVEELELLSETLKENLKSKSVARIKKTNKPAAAGEFMVFS